MCSKAVVSNFCRGVVRHDLLKSQPFSNLRFVTTRASPLVERNVFVLFSQGSACLSSRKLSFLQSCSKCFGVKCMHANFSQLPNKESLSEEELKSKISQQTDQGDREKGSDKNTDQDKWYSGKNAWKVGLASITIAGLVCGGSFVYTFGPPDKDENGNEITDEFSIFPKWLAYLRRAVKQMRIFKKMMDDPSSEKLLPDVMKEPYYQPPYTLVLELTGVLVHPDWTLATGWRFKKRPGLNHFLQEVSSMYEVVIYTHEQGMTAYPIIESMDTQKRVSYFLFRDSTKYVNGNHIKDLSSLNRDLKKVVIIDCDSKAMSMHPENGFLLAKWKGDDSDRKLVDLAAFLKTIAAHNVEDVRQVLEYYAQFDDPIEAFKEKQKALMLQEETIKVRPTQKSFMKKV